MKNISFPTLKVLFVIMLFLTVIPAFPATVKGHVKDAKTGETLIGATIYLKENNQVNTNAGLDGSYVLKNIQPGTYTLVAEFFSFKKMEKIITIKNVNDEITQDFNMQADSLSLKQVQIVGAYAEGSDNYARNEEKNSEMIMNVMSAKTIELLPDITIGDVLQRVSGVTVEKSATGGGEYATIRGMDKNYNYTTIDGVEIPSPDYGNRYIPMDIFPSEMVERLEVIKTLTPDMEANAIGGAMNLVLKDAPDRFFLTANVASGCNYTLFDKGFEQFNSSVINPNSPAQIYGPNYIAKFSDFPTANMTYKDISAPPDLFGGFTIGDRFFGGRFGILASASYQNVYSASQGMWIKQQSEPLPGPNPNTFDFDYISNRYYSDQQTRGAGHIMMDYAFNPKHKIEFYTVYVQMNELRSRIEQDTDNSLNNSELQPKYQSKVTYQHILSTTLKGKDTLAPHLFLDWTGAYSRAWENVPDWTDLSLDGAVGSPDFSYNGISMVWMQNTDQDFSGYVNLSYDFTLFGQKIELKTGAMNRDKSRDAYYNEYDFDPKPFQPVYTNINQVYANSKYDTLQNPLGMPQSNNTYSVQEDITAYYGMAKLLLFKRLEVVGGLRIENTSQSYEDGESDIIIAQSEQKQYQDVLPSIEFKYNLTDKQAIRASYFASLSRPSFIDLVPYTYNGDQFNQYGNPYLLHTTANNYDLRYEFFPKASEELLVGVFYKQIYNPIEEAIVRGSGPSAVFEEPVNIGGDSAPAINYGVECTVVKYIKNFGISANYTYTHSSITVPELIYRNTVGTGQPQTFYTTETRPLQGQANDIANLSFIYKAPKIGLQMQISAVYTGKSIYLISQYYGLDEWQMPMTTLAFSFEKRLSRKIKLSLYGKVNNILNTPLTVRVFPPADYTNTPNTSAWVPDQTSNGNISSILVQKETYGQNYLMGLRYVF